MLFNFYTVPTQYNRIIYLLIIKYEMFYYYDYDLRSYTRNIQVHIF